MIRIKLLLMSLVFLTAALGCKGCGDPCDGVPCALGEMCVEGECVIDGALCDPECEDGLVCQVGSCVALEAQCVSAGDECDASVPTTSGFLCLDLDAFGPRPGQCVENCAPDGSCPLGSLCFFIASTADPACTTTDDCDAGRECSGGTCLQTICRLSECDSFVEGGETCELLYENVTEYAGGAQCYEVGNGARYCYPAGDQQDGDTCGDVIDAIISGDYQATCSSGLACVDSSCRVACKADDVCMAEQECILEDVDLVDDETGICGDACAPFEVGSCGTGRTCLPVTAEEGVCADAGDTQPFDTCVPGAGDCTDGTICITYQQDPVEARCQPICNLTVAPPNDDGSVGEFAQTQRDATCPQPESADAWFAVQNLAEIGSGVDVYIGAEMTPTISALALDARSEGSQWLAVTPGSHAIKVLAAGAPRTDPPLAEQTVSFVTDGATDLFILPVAGATDEATLVFAPGVRDEPPPAPGGSKMRLLAALVDVPLADVIVVPLGDDLSDPALQIELATGLAPGDIGAFVELASEDRDLLVFAPGDPRTDRGTALFAGTVSRAPDQVLTLALRGTVDPDDLPFAGLLPSVVVSPPAAGAGGPSFWCVDVGAGPFGFCQQNCGNESAAFAGGFCEGAGMGCHPTFQAVNNLWTNLCAPLGPLALGDSCDPFAAFTQCTEGLYCLEYGNTVPDYSALQRGRCTSLCVEGVANDAVLACEAGQGCEAISADLDYTIAQCGFTCAPDRSYEDVACPAGLQSCKPQAALIDDPANPGALPAARPSQSFCSASGDVAAGQTCTANDCNPGSECMFPRSEQAGFTSTLLSQYFGAAGLTPACQPQCDPFEGDSSSVSCAADETCLFNFPYSAEVGHCAPLSVELDPLQACSNPGHACGRDSICVVNGGAPTCFQFCQYRGPDGVGELEAESCGPGLLCNPLVNDIGICLPPP